MRKISNLIFLVIVILLISVVFVSAEEPLKQLQLSFSKIFSFSPESTQFSLKEDYPVRVSERDVRAFWMEILENKSNPRQIPVNPRIEELERMIKKTKKKRLFQIVSTISFAALGGYFVYEYLTYGEQLEPKRDPISIQTKQPQFSRKRNYIFGALLTFGISAAFVTTSIQAKKRIKSYEKELKELRDAQERSASVILNRNR